MLAALISVICFAVILVVWNCAQLEQIKSARSEADMYRRLCDIEKRANAELRARLPKKKKAPAAPDPAEVRRRLQDGIARLVAEAMRG